MSEPATAVPPVPKSRAGSVPARGTAQLLAARVAFVGIGFAVSVVLGRALGDEAFGDYGVCLQLLVFLEMGTNAGLLAATGRRLQAAGEEAPRIAASARWTHVAASTAVFLALVALAPWLAGVLRLANGTALVRLAALDLPLAGLYFAWQGILNAERRFGTLALGFVCYALTKLAGVALLLALGVTIEGALVVNIAATLGGIAWFTARTRGEGIAHGRPSLALARALGRLAVPMGGYLVLAQGLLVVDFLLLKAWGGDAPEAGRYNAAIQVAKALGVVPAALSGVVFASIARALAHGDEALARHHVRAGGRFGLLVLLPAAALIGLHAEGLVRFVFGPGYAGAGPFLALVAALYALAALLDVYFHALMAAGHARAVVLLIALVLPVAVLLDRWWIPRFGGRGAASASLVAYALAGAAALVLVHLRLGPPLRAATALRVALATATVAALGWWVPSEGLGLVLELGLLVVLYGVLLLVSGEVRREEIRGMLSW